MIRIGFILMNWLTLLAAAVGAVWVSWLIGRLAVRAVMRARVN